MTRVVNINSVKIGGGNPIAIQSMTNTKTSDIEATISQIIGLQNAGCDIVRCSVPDEKSAAALKQIVAAVSIPVVADIHFDYKLAVLSAENGAAKIRVNPGNIGSNDKVRYLADFLKERSIPIRIGVNGGSLEKEFSSLPLYEAMTQSALKHIKLLEVAGFYDTVVSVKASNVVDTIKAYRLLSKLVDYPLHIGVTEAGTNKRGIVKSAIGIGSLLADGIGDTVRVSLSGEPTQEVYAAKTLLQCVGIDKNFVEVVSCPTCARTEIDVEKIALEIENATKDILRPYKIAVMGCIVNGIGESGKCNIGVAGGKHKSAIFKEGVILKTVPNEDITKELLTLLNGDLN